MANLTEEQKASFAENNARLGLGPEDYTAELSDEEMENLPDTQIMSSDPEKSHFPAHHISVGSIAEMRHVAGFPEEHVETDQDEPEYPDPPSSEELETLASLSEKKPEIDDDLKGRIQKAAEAYVLGNPEKVKDYEPLINAVHFPSKVAVFTGQTLSVPAGATHVISGSDPVVLNYEKIILGKDAKIVVETHHTITTQYFIQE